MRYKLHCLKQEKEYFIRQIDELEKLFYSIRTLCGDTTTTDKAQNLINRYKEKARATETEIKEFEALIESIPDEEVKKMAKSYFVKLENYEEIGNAHYLDRTTASRKLKRYFDL